MSTVLPVMTPSDLRHFTVMVKGMPVAFTSPYTNEQALARMREMMNPGGRLERSTFAQNINASALRFKGQLTANQWPWVHKMVIDAEKPREEVRGISESLSKVIDLFQNAINAKLKAPKIALQIDGVPIMLALAGPRSKYAGQIHVTDGGGYGNNIWYGRIDTDGTLHPSSRITDNIRNVLRELSRDPVSVAKEYGALTGRCCFCRKHLTDDGSTEVGYGPVCAKNYGLPWVRGGTR